MGQRRHRGGSGLSPGLLRPALRYPPGSAGLIGFPRAPPRPAGLAARAGAGSLKGRRARAAPLASALAGKGPAPRAGRELLKRHTRLPAPGAERASRGVSPPQGAGRTGRWRGWRRARRLPPAAWGARSSGLDSKFLLLPFTQSLGPPSPTAVRSGLPLQSLSLLPSYLTANCPKSCDSSVNRIQPTFTECLFVCHTLVERKGLVNTGVF